MLKADEPRNAPKSRWPIEPAKLNHARDWVIPNVKSLKENSLCHQVVELGFDSCDDATKDRFFGMRLGLSSLIRARSDRPSDPVPKLADSGVLVCPNIGTVLGVPIHVFRRMGRRVL